MEFKCEMCQNATNRQCEQCRAAWCEKCMEWTRPCWICDGMVIKYLADASELLPESLARQYANATASKEAAGSEGTETETKWREPTRPFSQNCRGNCEEKLSCSDCIQRMLETADDENNAIQHTRVATATAARETKELTIIWFCPKCLNYMSANDGSWPICRLCQSDTFKCRVTMENIECHLCHSVFDSAVAMQLHLYSQHKDFLEGDVFAGCLSSGNVWRDVV